MRRFISKTLRADLFKDIAKLSLGTLLGKTITLIALPFLTRMYSPESFSILAVYISIVSTIAVASCLRLEVAIPMAPTDSDAANLLGLSLLFSVLVSLLTLLALYFYADFLTEFLSLSKITPYLLLIPLGVFMMASYSAIQFWASRHHRFGDIARTRITQSVAGVSVMLSFGLLGGAPWGLLLGNAIVSGAGGGRLFAQALRCDKNHLRHVSLKGMADAFKSNSKYPKYSTIESLANIAGIQIPILIIASKAGKDAGYIFLAMQIMAAPVNLMGASISQVYISHIKKEQDKGTFYAFTKGMIRRLAYVGIAPLVLLGLVAPLLFPWVFGDQWSRAGEIIMWLTPWMVLQFMVSPISMSLHALGKQVVAMVLQVAGLALRVGSILIIGRELNSYYAETYAVSSALFYLTYLLVILYFCSTPPKR
ncbi:lipopolysaccharide biosynthesis protein [Pseudomonas sp. MT3]